MDNPVKAFGPATVANVGLGFDFMGFAVDGLGDLVEVSISREGCNLIRTSGSYGQLIPAEPEKNTAGVACSAMLRSAGLSDVRFEISIEKRLPLGSGMGSSASSAVAALMALNRQLGDIFTPEQLIPFAMEGEKAACGTAHADNVAPSLLGGFVIIRSNNPLDIIRIQCPEDLYCGLLHPQVELRTADARRVLKREIPLSDVTRQCANVASFITGLFNHDYDLIGRSMHDIVAEPKRQQLIPGYSVAREAALGAGAITFGISGSGPSLFALCRGKDNAAKIVSMMKDAMSFKGIDSDVYVTSLNAGGAAVI